MNRLLVEIEDEFYDSFNAKTYTLKVENSDCFPVNIFLYENQSVKNLFFEKQENCSSN